ncbi:imidazole glycerol phosphate synthase subunit HisH 2 [Bacteroidota bacterium]|nr:imidazole glycerol phosphate synthase subunit HisH 2 [Bacteroidota bacterium]
MIHIIDYGTGNISSIQNMLKKIGADSVITSIPSEIADAKKIILPGVGSFDTAMKLLKDQGWIEILNKKVLIDKTVVLGVCLGVQLMCNQSEEGKELGLGWIDADVVRFNNEKATEQIRVPHMGWNSVEQLNDVTLLKMNEEQRFYFVHAFHLANVHEENKWLQTHYGYDFISGVQKENIYGVQFHPEKSHRYGMELYKNFSELK